MFFSGWSRQTNFPDKVAVCCLLESGEKLQIIAEKEAEVAYSFADEGYFLYEGIGTFSINGEKARAFWKKKFPGIPNLMFRLNLKN